MKLLKSLILAGVAIQGFLDPCGSLAAERAKDAPNLIIILADDQGYDDVGFNGCKDIPTPNLDSIARNGVRFLNGYVSYAIRAGLLTGRYEHRLGHERNPRFQPDNPTSGLPLTETTRRNLRAEHDVE